MNCLYTGLRVKYQVVALIFLLKMFQNTPQKLFAIKLQFFLADPGNLLHLLKGSRQAADHVSEGAVMKDDKSREILLPGKLQPQGAQFFPKFPGLGIERKIGLVRLPLGSNLLGDRNRIPANQKILFAFYNGPALGSKLKTSLALDIDPEKA